MVSQLLLAVCLSLLLLPHVEAQQVFTESNPCILDKIDALKCLSAAHIQFAGEASIPDDEFNRFWENKETVQSRSGTSIFRLAITLNTSDVNFPALRSSEAQIVVYNNPHVETISFPKLERMEMLHIAGNPNLLRLTINPAAFLRNFYVEWNNKLPRDQLEALRRIRVLHPDLPESYDIQEEGDCTFYEEVTSLKQLDGCRRIGGEMLQFAKNVTDTDYPLATIELRGNIKAVNTTLRTLSFLKVLRGGDKYNVSGCTEFCIANNSYLCDVNLETKFQAIARVFKNCKNQCRKLPHVSNSTCTVLNPSVSVYQSNETVDLRTIEDFRGGVKIVGTNLPSLDGILASATRIHSTGLTALEIRDNGNLKDLSALWKLRTLRSNGRVKVKMTGNRVKMSREERAAFLRNTSLAAGEVEIEVEEPTGPAWTPTAATNDALGPEAPSKSKQRRAPEASNREDNEVEDELSDLVIGGVGFSLVGLALLGAVILMVMKCVRERNRESPMGPTTKRSTLTSRADAESGVEKKSQTESRATNQATLIEEKKETPVK